MVSRVFAILCHGDVQRHGVAGAEQLVERRVFIAQNALFSFGRIGDYHFGAEEMPPLGHN